ncbi:MAG: hypothetical protein QM778_15150 [Myxococcales bacterium]
MTPGEQFLGEYRDISTSQSRQRIGDAISRATAPMGMLVRSVAKKRLEEVNPAYPSIRITRRGDLLSATFAGQSYAASTDGTPRRNVAADGCAVYVSYSVEGNTLHARYKVSDGEKRFDLTHVPGTPRLGVQVTVTSKRLPKPVLYELAYVKMP